MWRSDEEIMNGILANERRLSLCEHHLFEIDATPEKEMFKRWSCSACGGEVDESEKYWYQLGIVHAGIKK